MTGSEFVRLYSNKGLPAWEAAALELARQGLLTPRPWADLRLTDGQNEALLKVQSDMLSIGPSPEDSVRLPMTPTGAQNILNLHGWLLPTPWLVYQIYKQAPIKLTPTSIADLGEQNRGGDLGQYARHSAHVDRLISAVLSNAPSRLPGPELVSGAKKHVVVSNIHKPDKVVIFGWYKPTPDVYDDGRPWTDPTRQPRQVKSNVHGSGYVDYSHGIQAIGPIAIVNGQPMATVDLYQHPVLSKLVSNEGPVRVPRYVSQVAPPALSLPAPASRPAHVASYPAAVDVVTSVPSATDLGLAEITRPRGPRGGT